MPRCELQLGQTLLVGELVVPADAPGVILFAHGSGSSRKSPRNQQVARGLQRAGLATLLISLLTSREEAIDRQTHHLRFDIRFLARRLLGAIDWLARQPSTAALPVGVFGSSTGAAAALVAAAERSDRVKAVVCRGGRPDLAWGRLREVRAPTLLLVGSEDSEVLELNRRAMNELGLNATMYIIPGADHLFEAPGAMERVIEHSTSWLGQHLLTAQQAPTEAEVLSPIR